MSIVLPLPLMPPMFQDATPAAATPFFSLPAASSSACRCLADSRQ
jgi:hypothetical protein